MIERTRMPSLRPAMPGRRQQSPRMTRSIGDAGAAPLHTSAAMISGSSSWFILATMRAGQPGLLVVDLPLDQLEKPRAHGRGATRSVSQCGSLRVASQVVKQVDDVACERWIAREEPDIGIESGRAHVVIAGADVRVTAQSGRLLAHDQRRLGMRLQAAYAKDHMGASPFQLRGPVQVALLVESGLELDHARHLFARFGRLDQRSDKGRVIANPIDGHLDRDRSGIVRGRADEVFHAGIEAVVRVVHEQVVGPNRIKDVDTLPSRRGRCQRSPWRIAQVRCGEAGNFKERRVVDLSGQVVDLVGGELKARPQHLPKSGIGAGRKLQPHDRLVATLPDLLPHQLTKSLVRVLVDLDFGVARQPHQRGRVSLHSRIELVGMFANDFVERHEDVLARRDIRGERHPLLQGGRHLDARIDALTRAVVVQDERQGSREIREEGKGLDGSITSGVSAGEIWASK